LIEFDKIYAEHYQTMSRVAVKITGDGDGVADILQDIFIDLYQKLIGGTEIRCPKSWLYKATYNKCIDNIRKQKKFKPIDDVRELTADNHESDRAEEGMIIKQAISKLKPKERLLAILYSEGLSYKEISEATGIRVTSVGTLLSRTLKKIEVELKKLNYELY
jgi:RNA polymerase sigma-70 factor, ECF subfamily